MPDISLENMVDVSDYREYEIKQMAALILARRLKVGCVPLITTPRCAKRPI